MAGAGGYFYGPDPAQLAAFRAGAHPSAIYDGKRNRKPVQRRTVDYSSTLVRYLQARTHQRTVYDQRALQPTPESTLDILPPRCYQHLPGGCFASKFVHQSMNKMRCSINVVQWTPEGRRLITGTMSGEFTLWNGQSFNFETILQAHDTAVRAMCWSHNDNWMVTGDDGGCIKYWQTNMNNVKANPSAHKEAVRGLSFCPTDLKYCSCSDDTSLKIWDFGRCEVDMNLTGHGWDVKCVDWHPTKALVVSGGKDNLIKFWDPASGSSINTLHGHKNTVMSVKWNQNGNWVLSASRDMLVKVYDIRTMREMATYRGHHREVTAIAWHPVQEEVFVSGSYDGAIYHWHMSFPTPQVEVTGAHESSVWSLAFHPLGHILCRWAVPAGFNSLVTDTVMFMTSGRVLGGPSSASWLPVLVVECAGVCNACQYYLSHVLATSFGLVQHAHLCTHAHKPVLTTLAQSMLLIMVLVILTHHVFRYGYSSCF
eukprot:jgi/Mesvir1/27297/Mv07130-RA.2